MVSTFYHKWCVAHDVHYGAPPFGAPPTAGFMVVQTSAVLLTASCARMVTNRSADVVLLTASCARMVTNRSAGVVCSNGHQSKR